MWKFFLLALFAAAAYVGFSSAALPPVVASHFGPGGVADGHMSRGTYTALMLALVIGIPGLIASTTQLLRILPPQMINLPNRQYWLAPERLDATLEAMASLTLRFALALAVFLCFVHALVVRAHASQPPRLSEGPFFVGLALFCAVTLVWIVALYRRFGRVP